MPPKKKSKADAQPWSFESIDNAQVTENGGKPQICSLYLI
jgi:hypothetical protein